MERFFHYFGFTKTEQRGFFIFVLLVSFICVIKPLYTYFRPLEPSHSSVVYFSDLQKSTTDREGSYHRSDDRPLHRDINAVRGVITYFDFDPNHLPAADWKKIGFSDKQIAVITNYRSKGGVFRSKEDVAKMYSISEKEYDRIAPYIKIGTIKEYSADPRSGGGKQANAEIKKDIRPIAINMGDTSAFKGIYGIGSVLSARIVKYREKLGGYYCVDQLAEVYGISPEQYESMKKKVVLDSVALSRLAINTIDKDELSKHPYISYKQAQVIVNYRNQHGVFKDLNDLKKILILDDLFFRKIEPYLKF